MVNLIALIAGTIIVVVIGGGLGYFFWLKTRPSKESWTARVYQLSESVRDSLKDDKGNIIPGSITLSDLKPYAIDVLEKVTKDPGIDIYRLQKLNKTTSPVEGDVVDYWGPGKKEVSVMMHKGSCTLLKKGYDKKSGEEIFHPMSHSRINVIKGEMAFRKDRLHKEKDILQAITPWIVTGIMALGLVAVAIVVIDGYVKMADKLERASENWLNMEKEMTERQLQIEQLKTGVRLEPPDLGQQEAELNEET